MKLLYFCSGNNIIQDFVSRARVINFNTIRARVIIFMTLHSFSGLLNTYMYLWFIVLSDLININRWFRKFKLKSYWTHYIFCIFFYWTNLLLCCVCLSLIRGPYDLHIKVYLHPILPNETFFPTFSYSKNKIP